MTTSDTEVFAPGPAAGASAAPLRSQDQPAVFCGGRPSDQRRPWWFDFSGQIRALTQKAISAGVSIDAAASIALEFQFLRSGVPHDSAACHFTELVDRGALGNTLNTPLSPASSAYLSALVFRNVRQLPVSQDRVKLVLPIRITDQVGDPRSLLDSFDDANFDVAVAWEIAAQSAGSTMSEWFWRALFTATREDHI